MARGTQAQTQALAQQLQTRAAATQAGGGRGRTVADLLLAERDRIAAVLPKTLTPERLIMVMVSSLRTTPKLAECTPESLIGALHYCAELGLMPGPLGHVYLVPYWNGQRKVYEAQPIIGYRGLLELIRRGSTIRLVAAHPVWPQDTFEVDLGSRPQVTHRPAFAARQGDPYLFYALAAWDSETWDTEVMTRAEVDAIRARSRAKDSGPWVSDYTEMARKTVLRRLAKRLPLAWEAAVAIGEEEAREYGDETAQRAWTALAPDAGPTVVDLPAPAPAADSVAAPAPAAPPADSPAETRTSDPVTEGNEPPWWGEYQDLRTHLGEQSAAYIVKSALGIARGGADPATWTPEEAKKALTALRKTWAARQRTETPDGGEARV
jgi:recombination protein RecT